MSYPDKACTVNFVAYEAPTIPELLQKVASWEGWNRLEPSSLKFLGPITFNTDESNSVVSALWSLTRVVSYLNSEQEFDL